MKFMIKKMLFIMMVCVLLLDDCTLANVYAEEVFF